MIRTIKHPVVASVGFGLETLHLTQRKMSEFFKKRLFSHTGEKKKREKFQPEQHILQARLEIRVQKCCSCCAAQSSLEQLCTEHCAQHLPRPRIRRPTAYSSQLDPVNLWLESSWQINTAHSFGSALNVKRGRALIKLFCLKRSISLCISNMNA